MGKEYLQQMGNDIIDNKVVIEDDFENDTLTDLEEWPIFVQLKSFLSETDSQKLQKDLTEIKISENISGKMIKKKMYLIFNVNREYVLKLRNKNNSIIPFSNTIQENTPSIPYVLEVTYQYQNVTPLPRTISVPTYEQVLRRKLTNTNNRMLRLEDFIPELPVKQKVKIEEEIKDSNDKMNILERKINAADSTQWQGMFKRVPLW